MHSTRYFIDPDAVCVTNAQRYTAHVLMKIPPKDGQIISLFDRKEIHISILNEVY